MCTNENVPEGIYAKGSTNYTLSLNLTRDGDAKRVKLGCISQVVPGIEVNDTQMDSSYVPDINRMCTHLKVGAYQSLHNCFLHC